jgi:hypothetical protein
LTFDLNGLSLLPKTYLMAIPSRLLGYPSKQSIYYSFGWIAPTVIAEGMIRVGKDLREKVRYLYDNNLLGSSHSRKLFIIFGSFVKKLK